MDLKNLKLEDIKKLPDDISVQDLDPHNTYLRPESVIALLTKLKPKGTVDLSYIDLSGLTADAINSLPDELSFQKLILDNTNISPEIETLLRQKLTMGLSRNRHG